MTPHAPKIFVASSPIPGGLRYHISQTFRASGSLYPLTAPAYALPESLLTFAKAELRCLHNPWPHGKGPTTTRAWPGMVLLVSNLRKRCMEAAECMLVLHARKLDLFLVEELFTLVILLGLAPELQPLSLLCCLRCLSRSEQVVRPVVRRDTWRLLGIPEAATIIIGASTIAWNAVVAPHILAVDPTSIWVKVFNVVVGLRYW